KIEPLRAAPGWGGVVEGGMPRTGVEGVMGGEKILVVDDEASVRGAVSQVLREDGHQVSAVASGEEALAAFGKEPYPLVVSDIRLGSMDGLELWKEIKRIHSDTEVVIMTGHRSEERRVGKECRCEWATEE